MSDGPEMCSGCGKQPPRAAITLGELITDTHFCDPCWEDRVKLLHSHKGEIEQTAQAQTDKILRDVEKGKDPVQAWKDRDEDDA